MIQLNQYAGSNEIIFDHFDKQKIIYWLSRAANTLSPQDPVLIKLLDDLKSETR